MKSSDLYKEMFLSTRTMRDGVIQPDLKRCFSEHLAFLAMQIETSLAEETVERKASQ